MTAKKAFPLRLDPALHEALERAAAADLRSLNAQIEVLLREALAKRGVKVAVTPAPKRGRPAAGDTGEQRSPNEQRHPGESRGPSPRPS